MLLYTLPALSKVKMRSKISIPTQIIVSVFAQNTITLTFFKPQDECKRNLYIFNFAAEKYPPKLQAMAYLKEHIKRRA